MSRSMFLVHLFIYRESLGAREVRRGETQDHTKTKGDGLRVNPVSLSAKIHD